MAKIISIIDSEHIAIDMGKVDSIKIGDVVTIVDNLREIDGYDDKKIIIPIKKQDFVVSDVYDTYSISKTKRTDDKILKNFINFYSYIDVYESKNNAEKVKGHENIPDFKFFSDKPVNIGDNVIINNAIEK